MAQSKVPSAPDARGRSLPPRANLEHLKNQAKHRLGELRRSEPRAKLADAQYAVAKEYGFTSWRALKAHIDAIQLIPSEVKVELFKAVWAGEVDAVTRVLIQWPAIIQATAPHPQWGGRPQVLHLSIERGDRAMFDLLLDAGAHLDGDNREYDGWSPLMLAIHWKRDDMRDELIRRGASVGLIAALMLADDARVETILRDEPWQLHRPIPNRATPLHFARTRRAAELLIDADIAIDGSDKYGKTPLDCAVALGDAGHDVAELLVERGVAVSPVNLVQQGDLNGLQRNIKADADALKRLYSAGDVQTTLLHAAVESGQLKVVRWLVGRRVDVNQLNSKGTSPLHAAAWQGRLPIVKWLVQAGADVHAHDHEHDATPAQWARHNAQMHGKLECVAVAEYLEKQMKTKRASRASTPKGWKPIMDAAYAGNAAKVEQCLKAGADPNVLSPTPHRHRPLHRAIERKKTSPRGAGHEEVVRVLLAAGADPKLRGTHGLHTALQLAAIDEPRFVPLLLDRFRPLDFWHACVMLDDKRVGALLKKDPSLASRRDENEWLPLHYVVGSKLFTATPQALKAQLRLAGMLLDAGADLNATFPWNSKWPIPVLYFACGYHDNPVLTEFLLQRGAQPYDNESIYHASDEGHAACLAVIEKHAEPRKLNEECTKCLRTQLHWGATRGMAWLLAHGADPNSLYPETGHSALHAAARYGASEKVIATLLKHGADPLVESRDGQTAIDIAKAMKKTRVLKQLQEHLKRSR